MLLSAQHLALRRGRQIILRDASLELHPREVVALIGGNGAGKTTLLEILTGALTPDAGSVHYQAGLPAFGWVICRIRHLFIRNGGYANFYRCVRRYMVCVTVKLR